MSGPWPVEAKTPGIFFRVGLNVIENNRSALRPYEKAGFHREGVARGAVLRDGRRYDVIFMGILREEWQDAAVESP